jgi:acylphosphatase
MIRKRVIVHGYVQGVFFRDSVRGRAQAAGVAGWIRNNPDGTVEGVFEGDPTRVDRLVAFCRRGPRGAEVERVDVVDEAPEGITEFRVA